MSVVLDCIPVLDIPLFLMIFRLAFSAAARFRLLFGEIETKEGMRWSSIPRVCVWMCKKKEEEV